ncbi:uncharacterized protein E0L32_000002 [Thyridium curvatum]|uniref:Uncharacterized protein n=1 Tax=Thyridium curvatum TaxID=1093900 RepID=A0A507BG34_9PEZI|nr:uncharacterized protein E0L32_000002 [Thyridium curvatum]TPX15668.1 hypothetical protein E0L32_000002 [Thyridium curvatum]
MEVSRDHPEEELSLEDTRMSFDFESAPTDAGEDSDNASDESPPPVAAPSPQPQDPEQKQDAAHPEVLNSTEDHEQVVISSDVVESAWETGKHTLPIGNISNLFEIALRILPPDVVEQYRRPPPSDHVLQVLERVGVSRGAERYMVEFDDGRVEEMSYDDLVNFRNGRNSLKAFTRSDPRLDQYANMSKKRKFNQDSDYDSDALSELSEMDEEGIGGFDDGESDEENDSDVVKERMRSRGNRRLQDLLNPRRRSSRQASLQTSATGTSGDDHESDSGRRRLRSRNTLRSANNGTHNGTSNAFDDDADELAGDDDDGDYTLVRSDLQPIKPKRRRKTARGRPAAAYRALRDDSIEFEARRSSRSNKNTKNMADMVNVDDDVYVEEDRAPAAPKVVSMKEVFPLVSGDFRDVHSHNCDTCYGGPHTAGKGPLIPCQGCSLSHHKACLGVRSLRDHLVTKIGPEHFVLQCRYCIGLYKKKDPTCPSHDMCQACHEKGLACAPFSTKKTPKQEEKLRQENGGVDPVTPVDGALVNKAQNVLFRCKACHRAYHVEHLPMPAHVGGDVESDLRTDCLEEYAIEWKCRDCLDQTEKVAGLVAWRPRDRQSYQPGQQFSDFSEDDKEYLVRWEGKSYAHCTWKPGAWIWGVTNARMRTAFAKHKGTVLHFEEKDAIPMEYLLADIMLALKYNRNVRATSKEEEMQHIVNIAEAKLKFQGLSYDEAVWDKPPPRDSGPLWTAFEAAYREYLSGKYFENEPVSVMRARISEHLERADEFVDLKVQPAGLKHKLLSYQMDGLNWLLCNFYMGKSVVLADEMGLGKTVQVIAFITSLVQDSPRCWPFLIVVPNSTCPNWRREIKTWAPDLRVVTYHGGKAAQTLAYENELFPGGSKDMKAHVVIMSYDSAQDDETRRLFKSVQWAGLVVDEGQRLKNDGNLLYGALQAMKIDFRLLLTGTPLQNNKRELFNLLQFIDPTKNAAVLDAKYEDINAENLPEIHSLIRPYFFRRTKNEVLSKIIPPMGQIIVPVTMTSLQEKLCKSIIAKNPDLIRSIFAKGKMKATERGSLNNILMQLRKCLCHPFVYSQAIEERVSDQEALHRNLIEASSKLLLLNIMLPKLKARGHRVLLFSQFLTELDIIEDFLAGIGLSYQRLDGSMSSLEKQKRIDAFNAPGSEFFAFLLSTRAGGVGINLATADTVIILDPDFNPHQDIQAFSRAHRIGQKKKVLCFQLMTKDSVEEKIMQIGRKKMALDHALIESMDVEDDAGNDLESILKHGAESLFDGEKKDVITYDSASVDKLLDRSQIEETKTDVEKSSESQFSFARVWTNDAGELADDLEVREVKDTGDTSVWDKIIKEREEAARLLAEREKVTWGRGGRRRQAVRYSAPKNNYYGLEDGQNDGLDPDDEESDVDADFINNGVDSAEESDPDAMKGIERGDQGRKPGGKPPSTKSQAPRTVDLTGQEPQIQRRQGQVVSGRETPVQAPKIPYRGAGGGGQLGPTLPAKQPGPVQTMPPVPPSHVQQQPIPTSNLPAPSKAKQAMQPPKGQRRPRNPTLAPCKSCFCLHLPTAKCPDLSSEVDLRLAIDAFTFVPQKYLKFPEAQEAQEALRSRLRELVTQGGGSKGS